MRFQMVDRDQRLALHQRDGLGGGQADDHAADQAGAGGGGDAVEPVEVAAGLASSPARRCGRAPRHGRARRFPAPRRRRPRARSIWRSTTLDRILPRPSSKRSTTAAAVSSQVVSMPRTIMKRRAPLSGTSELKGALASRGDMTQSADTMLRIGTRGSPLALVQARMVRGAAGRGARRRRGRHRIGHHPHHRRRHPGPAAGGGRRQGPVHQGDRGGAARRAHRSRRAFGQGHADVAAAGLDAGGLPRTRGCARRVHQPQGRIARRAAARRDGRHRVAAAAGDRQAHAARSARRAAARQCRDAAAQARRRARPTPRCSRSPG